MISHFIRYIHLNHLKMCFSISALWVECLPMTRATRVQTQVASYQRLRKWYLIPLCLIFSIKRYVSKVNWNNPGWGGVAPSSTPRCSSYWKGSLWVALDYGRQLYFTTYFILHWIYLMKSPLVSTISSRPPWNLLWAFPVFYLFKLANTGVILAFSSSSVNFGIFLGLSLNCTQQIISRDYNLRCKEPDVRGDVVAESFWQ